MCESAASTNLAASVVDLRGASVGRGRGVSAGVSFHKRSAATAADTDTGVSSGANILRIIWHSLHGKYEYLRSRTETLRSLMEREANKPLAKKFRRSLRLNKSAKQKGYEFFMTDEDKRRLDEYQVRQHHLATRLGVPFECQPLYA